MQRLCITFFLLTLLLSACRRTPETEDLDENENQQQSPPSSRPFIDKPDSSLTLEYKQDKRRKKTISKTEMLHSPEREGLLNKIVSRQILDPFFSPLPFHLKKNPLTSFWKAENEVRHFLSDNKYLILDFDNDIFAETDYYFTNGAQISLVLPTFNRFPLYRLMPDAGRHSINYFGIGLRQNMYTPIHPESDIIVKNDRPFAGVLYLEFFKISTSLAKNIQLQSSILLGVVGRSSLASFIQSGLHETKPIGWQYQIKDDFIFNYRISVTKQLYGNEWNEINLVGSGNIGTYRTDIEAGISINTGRIPAGRHPFTIAKTGTMEYVKYPGDWRLWFSLEAIGRYNFHDATYEGGFLNQDSPHLLERADRIKQTIQVEAGINTTYKRNSLSLKFIYLSPEFKDGVDHRWGTIGIIRNF